MGFGALPNGRGSVAVFRSGYNTSLHVPYVVSLLPPALLLHALLRAMLVSLQECDYCNCIKFCSFIGELVQNVQC